MKNEKSAGKPKGTPKTGGRKKGTPNKVTGDLRSFINDLLNDNRAQILKDLKAVEPAERLRIYERLLSYAIPKMQQNEISGEGRELVAPIIQIMAPSHLED